MTSIGSSAFYGCKSLTSITIPKGISSIEESTFYGCTSLASITIPNDVTSINKSAFYGCTSLTHIDIVAKTPEEFARIKLLLPPEMQAKARNLVQQIKDDLEAFKNHLVTTSNTSKNEDWETINTELSNLQSMIARADSASKEQQEELDSVIVGFYQQQNNREGIIDYLNYGPISSSAAFEAMSALFPNDLSGENSTTIYPAIIHLFKENDEDKDIRKLLEKAVISRLGEKDTPDLKLSFYAIDRCLPCSAIIKTIMESKTIGDELKTAFKAISDKLPSMTINEMRTLLGGSPFKEALEEHYGKEQRIVSYESIIMQDPTKPYNQQGEHIPITVDFLKTLGTNEKMESYDNKIKAIFNAFSDTKTTTESPLLKEGFFSAPQPLPDSSPMENHNKTPKAF